jgi:hypothetical protein
MHIRWLVDWPGDAGSLSASSVASHRYRTGLPAQALRAQGHRIDITTLGELRNGADLLCDVLVVGKLFFDQNAERLSHSTGLFLRAAEGAAKSVADVNDNHFSTPGIADYWRRLCKAVNVCTVGSSTMGQYVSEHAAGAVVTVGDPLASPSGEPRVYRSGFFSRKPLKIAWYGVGKNFPAFGDAAYAIMARPLGVPVEFHVVTAKHPKVDEVCRVFSEKFGSRGSMMFHPWSDQEQWSVVTSCDLVLIPSDPADPTRAVKSANRLTDAIHAGRYVIASPVPAYLPYTDVVTITDDIPGAIQQYVSDPGSALARLKAGQARVEQDCGADAIADQWLRAFNA